MNPNDEYIIEILESVGLIDHSVAAKAVVLAERDKKAVVDVLVDSGMLTKEEIQKTLAAQFGMEYVRIDPSEIDLDVIDSVPSDVAKRYKILPLYRQDHALVVALSDPLDVDTLDTLRIVLKTNVEGVVADAAEIKTAIQHFYPVSSEMGSAMEELTQATVFMGQDTQELLAGSDSVSEEDAPVIKMVSLLIMEAFKKRSSDIHIEPMEKELRVRYRTDGVLQKVQSPPKRLQPAIISRLKIMANMSIAEKRIAQDGRIQINVMGRDLDLRVSSVPASHGESIVMRILDKEGLSLGLPQLGFFSDDQAVFEKFIHLSDGIILVTGPTGSGKTTTLYACLNEINKPDRKIITVEDPVEYQMSGINQVHVRANIGLTFGAALRSILRQAPNIIMIGEIRDLETAEIAVNASMTGHLVFSTLHTNDAPSAVTRLADIGVKPFLVASALRGVMAQRLVRKICEKCRQPYQMTDNDRRLLGQGAEQLEQTQLYHGRGCEECNHTGYRGRIGLFEIFEIDEQVQRLIYENVTSVELRAKARENGMRTLREDGIRKVLAGRTTIEEVFRVTMGDDG